MRAPAQQGFGHGRDSCVLHLNHGPEPQWTAPQAALCGAFDDRRRPKFRAPLVTSIHPDDGRTLWPSWWPLEESKSCLACGTPRKRVGRLGNC